MEKINEVMEKIDALTIRERGIILAGIIFVMYTVWDTLFMAPQVINEQMIISDLRPAHLGQ